MRCLAAWSRWDWPTMRESAPPRRPRSRARRARLAWRSGVYEAIALVTAGRHDEAMQRLEVDPRIDVTRDDLALAGVVHSYIALDSGRLDEVAPRYREMLDLLARAAIRCSGTSACRAACSAAAVDARAVAPLRGRRARGRARHADAAARDRPGDVGVERRLVGPPRGGSRDGRAGRSRCPLARAAAQRRLALYSLLAVLFAMLGRRQESYGAADEILVLFDDPGGGYRRDSPLYAFYRLFAIRVADWHGDSTRVERLARELRQPRPGRRADAAPVAPGAAARPAGPARLAIADWWREGPATHTSARSCRRGPCACSAKTPRFACAWQWRACTSPTSTPRRRRSLRCSKRPSATAARAVRSPDPRASSTRLPPRPGTVGSPRRGSRPCGAGPLR
jgi:hypothetical protein